MHENRLKFDKRRAPDDSMSQSKKLTLAEFDCPFQTACDENNRWVKMAECLPWDELADGYYQSLSAKQGRSAKARD